VLVVLVGLLADVPADAQQTSRLWGEHGERWGQDGRAPQPGTSRLRDFSNVGYRRGDVAIPDWPVGVSVTDFGAKPDDRVDDTQAFLDAIAACPDRHAVLVPRGRYMIARQIAVRAHDYFVLRGEDMYETVLFFPKYLVETDSKESYKPTEMEGMILFDGGTHRSIENLTLQHRDQIKGGHWEFRGADGITLDRVEDSWVRNVYIKNADHGITLHKATHNSVVNVIFDHSIHRPDITGTSAKYRWVGHVGIGLGGSSHNLFHNIEFRGKFFHDFDIINVPSHNVISNVTGPDLALHHHGQGAKYNLYTNVHAGKGTRVFSIAPKDRGRQTWETHWGVFADNPIDPESIPTTTSRGHVFVGIDTTSPTRTTDAFWYESIDPDRLHPKNIYLAQLAYLGKPLPDGPPPPPPAGGTDGVILINPIADVGPGKKGDGTWLPVGSYLKFDLRGLAPDRVEKARLRVFTDKGLVNAPLTVGVAGIDDDGWSEDGLTRANQPDAGPVLDTIQLDHDRRKAWLDFDVTGFVRAQAAGDGVVSLQLPLIRGEGFVGGYNSREHGNAPVLVLQTRPATHPGPPAPPTGVTTTAGPGYVALDWDDHPEADVVSYNVYRRTAPTETDDWRMPIATGLVTSDFRDVALKANRSNYDLPSDTEFYYVVTAVDKHAHESDKSVTVAGRAAPRP